MTPETKLDLEAIRARAAAATPEPWRIGRLVECAEDFVFSAHARTDVPALVAEVERLQGRVAELEAVLEDVRDNYDCDEDAHKYRTPCRACEAKRVLLTKGGA